MNKCVVRVSPVTRGFSFAYKSFLATGLLLATFITAGNARAEDGGKSLIFMDNSVSLLTGTGFEVPGENISTVTFEHVSKWKWGDVFGFFDYLDYHSNPTQSHSWYGEFSPRLSLTGISLIDLPKGSFVRDVLVSTTWEKGRGGTEALLLGMAADLNMPGFKFFKTNVYARKNTSLGDGFDDMQVTLSWSRPFEIGEERFTIDGFLDYAMGWASQEEWMHLVPQIKWDVGARWGEPGKVYFGTEIDIWVNQFGIKDTPAFNTNQIAASAILKVHF